MFPHAKVVNLGSPALDHNLILLDRDHVVRYGRPHYGFKFEPVQLVVRID
jgi:hypothetical protein